jgi:hypothetical protein
MVSLQQQKLPHLFAVMDPAPSLPSRYYVYMTYEEDDPSTLVVNNMKFNKPFSVWMSHADQTAPYKTKVYHENSREEVTYWETGINVISDQNEFIPVLDFKTPVFLPDTSRHPAPVYVTPDSIISKSQHQIIFRERRNHMLELILEQTYASIHMTLPPPPAIQRIHPVLDNQAHPPSFTLPPHASATFVKSLIQENKMCSITTNSFSEIDVVGITPCFHCFDCEALETWLFSHNTCPECRSTVSNIVKYKR